MAVITLRLGHNFQNNGFWIVEYFRLLTCLFGYEIVGEIRVKLLQF